MVQAIYVHVPFCNHICAYCDFMRCGYHKPLADAWLMAVKRELQEKSINSCRTIYIGGGTPSSLSAIQLRSLLAMLQPYMQPDSEVTIEANADSFNEEKIKICCEYGVNRISMGAQTFQPGLLKRIERIADFPMIQQRIQQLHEYGISNISLDLMYGLPDQTMQQWISDLHKAAALPITHLSLYALTIEEHSKFGREHVAPCEDDLEADFYETALQILKEHGFEHYEISSFARGQCYSQHNLAYWHYDDFYGIGCGASGKEHHERYENTRNLHTYIQSGASSSFIKLTKEDEMFEMIMMGLRIKEGVSDKLFFERFQCSYHEVFASPIKKHMALHHLKEIDHHLSTTKQGMMILHDILVDFL